MTTWVLALAVLIAVVLILIWIDPGIGAFVALGTLPYLIAHLLIREEYVHSIRRGVADYTFHRRRRHFS